jgi:hypothetical protein
MDWELTLNPFAIISRRSAPLRDMGESPETVDGLTDDEASRALARALNRSFTLGEALDGRNPCIVELAEGDAGWTFRMLQK